MENRDSTIKEDKRKKKFLLLTNSIIQWSGLNEFLSFKDLNKGPLKSKVKVT
jgi:hypothetical protein